MANVVSKQERIQNEKDGGPYTKDERTKRQNEVARLHFEYGYSAVKIAEMMKVNRNTINSDIKYLYSEIKKELKQNRELCFKANCQTGSTENKNCKTN